MSKIWRAYKPIGIILIFLLSNNLLAQEISDPCKSEYLVSTLSNRGGISESPCAIPYQNAFLEGGYFYSQFGRPISLLQSYPQPEFRFGLPELNEIFIHIPTYNTQSPFHSSSTAGLGLKHQFAPSIAHLASSIEGIIYFPGGGFSFGNKDVGLEANSIFIYDFTPKLSTTYILKLESISPPKVVGEGRFTNFSPGFVLNYGLNEHFIIFGQVYGLTKTAPNSGGALNVVFGFFYLFNKRIALDMEYYRQLTNNINQYRNSFGLGLSILL